MEKFKEEITHKSLIYSLTKGTKIGEFIDLDELDPTLAENLDKKIIERFVEKNIKILINIIEGSQGVNGIEAIKK